MSKIILPAIGTAMPKLGGTFYVHTQLARAVDANLLVRSRSDDGEYLYTKGQELKENTVCPDQPPA